MNTFRDVTKAERSTPSSAFYCTLNCLFNLIPRSEEFINVLERLHKDAEFYQESAELAFAGHKFYSREHVGNMWKNFYERVFQEEEEKGGAESRHMALDGSVILWEEKKQQYI